MDLNGIRLRPAKLRAASPAVLQRNRFYFDPTEKVWKLRGGDTRSSAAAVFPGFSHKLRIKRWPQVVLELEVILLCS